MKGADRLCAWVAQLGATCKALQARVASALKRGRYRARLLVVCSGANTLQEYNLATGAPLAGGAAGPCKRNSASTSPSCKETSGVLMGPHARSLHGAQGCLGCPPGVCAPIRHCSHLLGYPQTPARPAGQDS